MRLRTKILIAVFALVAATIGVWGDQLFIAAGFPSRSGRAIVAGILLFIGIVWFAWTSYRWRLKDSNTAAGSRRNKPGDKLG